MPRVLILSAGIGEGHDLPARVLADAIRAERPDTRAEVADGLAAMGGVVTSVVQESSRVVLRYASWLYDMQYWLLARFPPTRWLARAIGYRLGANGLLNLVARHDPDAVVSTYPGVTEILGRLRLEGRLAQPLCSAITDLASLRYWAHPGVDLHLLTHPESAEEVRKIAGRETRIEAVRGLTSEEFFDPLDPLEARRALDLPADAKIVVVSGGGWGVGDLRGAIEVVLEAEPTAVAVCLCGRDERLLARMSDRFEHVWRVRVLGFTDRMGELLAAADALVHSTAGLTVLEAHIRGCPVISYGWGVGHIRVNNQAFARFGLAQVATSRRELAEAVHRALAHRNPPDLSFAALPSAASAVLGLAEQAAHRGGGAENPAAGGHGDQRNDHRDVG